MHGSRAMVADYVAQLSPVDQVEMVIFPPLGYLGLMAGELRSQAAYVALGAQDVHDQVSGAFTGESSAEMVADLGGSYTIVGHSERRLYASETDVLIARKASASLRAGLHPIVCVGESLDERTAGAAEAVVERQLSAVAAALSPAEFQALIVAYEPVWAIGTGRSASLAQVEEMHGFIRQVRKKLCGERCASTILYGGSVNESNAAGFFDSALVDGALVGGAALDGHRFVTIARMLQTAKG